MPADKVIKFFHGASTGIEGKITDGTINESDIIITSDSNEIVYVDENKTPQTLGSSKTKEVHEVNLGGSIGGLADGAEIPTGTTLDEFIAMLIQKKIPPTYTQPGVTIRTTAGQGAGSYEVGTNISTTLQAIYTKNDGGDLGIMYIYETGTGFSDSDTVVSGSASPLNSEAQTFQVPDGTREFYATAVYGDGPIKNDNLGQPSPEGQIKGATKSSSHLIFTGKRNLFYGTGVGSVPEVTSELVRGLSGKQLGPSNGTSFNISIAVGQQYVIFAYPATLRDVSQVMYVETNDTGMASSFTKSTISVQGANGATGADYKIYTYGMATPAAAPMTFKVTI